MRGSVTGRVKSVATRLPSRVRVGTRGSALALKQTDEIVRLLRKAFPELEFEIVPISTQGDRVQHVPIASFGDKAVFVQAIERALLGDQIDLAVHSLKDVPADRETDGLTLAFSAREDPRDILVSRYAETLDLLAAGARVGTGSLRRHCMLHAVRPDLVTLEIRGNVDTRLRKLDAGEYDAIILAAAGMHRLGLQPRISEYLPLDQFVPDAGQGIVAIQTRTDDFAAIAKGAEDVSGRTAALAERAVVRAMGANCQSPVGVYASITGEHIEIHAAAAAGYGFPLRTADAAGIVAHGQLLGTGLGESLRAQMIASGELGQEKTWHANA